MLEGRSTEKRTTTKAVSRKRSSLREDDGYCDGVKRRKVAGERERLNATEETVESSKDDVNEMKGMCVLVGYQPRQARVELVS